MTTSTGNGDRELLLVVGIGRSGTSVFTGILSQLGWYVPQPEVQADDTNPRGFGEPRWAVDFHTRLLRQRRVTNFDSRPHAWDLTDTATATPAVVAELRAWLEEQFQRSDRVVVKDPRNAWFLELWRRCATDLGVQTSFATMLRHPTEVLTSARKSYGTWQNDGSRAAGWLNVMLATEQSTRDARRVFVHYGDVLQDWGKEIRRVSETLALPWLATAAEDNAAAVDAFVEPGLHRNHVGWDKVEVPLAVQQLTDRVWDQMSRLTASGAVLDPALAADLDRSLADYRRLYAEAEAIAQSSIHAVRPRRRSGAGESPRAVPPVTLAGRARRLVPARLRAALRRRPG